MMTAQDIASKHNAGHNTDPSGKVRQFVDRLVNLETEKQDAVENIKDLKTEAKEQGVDPKALAAVVKLRMESDNKREKREAFETTRDHYLQACGLLD